MRVYVVVDSVDADWENIYVGSDSLKAVKHLVAQEDRTVEVWVDGVRTNEVSLYFEEDTPCILLDKTYTGNIATSFTLRLILEG
ncbi:hypothetical protein BH780_gp147 [Bacillus phage Eldridge]|uniref:Uncharacterized protein n=1 Tax=Bacillus phage Eldridge TaxID=1776293 RepID=A0A109Z8G0_9CAUD|nr:hypothetical protein BH780_gp147 [Bacillus phage Eldridge]AMB18730.1 hypothetical protein Eldridge_0150 [Bacillus phage Eldridge]